VRSPEPAEEAALLTFHTEEYLNVLKAANTGTASAAVVCRYGLGPGDNPIFPGLWDAARLAAGGSLLAARLVAGGEVTRAFHFAGGLHHAMPDRASGFCYVNDAVLAILHLRARGLRVAYVDIDAHHGDGVQDALSGDGRVLILSIHEQGRWPHSGAAADRGGGNARNLPVPPGFGDRELDFLTERVILPLGRSFAPQAVMLQAGADGLADDPMSNLALGNRAIWRVAERLRVLAPRMLVLGGGGYNPWSVARCWAGLWATLAGHDPLQPPTAAARALLGGISWQHRLGRTPRAQWLETIADPPQPGPMRPEIAALAAAVLE